MISNLSTSAVNLMSTAQHKAADAAHTIATLPVSIDGAEYSSNDMVKPLLSLKEAEIESSAAVKILQTEKENLGSLFDAMS